MSRHADRGFTLVELLVSTALLALLMVALLAALRSFGQTEDRLDDRLRRDAELRTSGAFLRGVIAATAPRPLKTAPGTAKRIEFGGAPAELRWVGVMPAREGAGGLYRFRLALQPDAESATLLLQFAPYVAGDEIAVEGRSHESRAMAGHVRSISLHYLGDEANATWLSSWPRSDVLPHRVGLAVVTDRDAWPEIVVTIVPVSGPDAPPRRGPGPSAPSGDAAEAPT